MTTMGLGEMRLTSDHWKESGTTECASCRARFAKLLCWGSPRDPYSPSTLQLTRMLT